MWNYCKSCIFPKKNAWQTVARTKAKTQCQQIFFKYISFTAGQCAILLRPFSRLEKHPTTNPSGYKSPQLYSLVQFLEKVPNIFSQMLKEHQLNKSKSLKPASYNLAYLLLGIIIPLQKKKHNTTPNLLSHATSLIKQIKQTITPIGSMYAIYTWIWVN